VIGALSGFDWDDGNRDKCRRHGVSPEEIEALFAGPLLVRPDAAHAGGEERFQAVGAGRGGRRVFLVFTIRLREGRRLVRPISARYMHRKEVARFEEDNPGL
jgi:uncharacterized DUF497 family protein